MPLPPAAPRRKMHARTIVCEGFARDDGLWDIEGRIVDTKEYRYTEPYRGARPTGTHVHDMVVRLTIDGDMTVRDIAARHGLLAVAPTALKAPGAFRQLIGASVGPGWRKRVQAAAGGVAGCTHVREMLPQMATVAFQTVNGWPQDAEGASQAYRFDTEEGKFVDGCIGWSRDGEMVATLHPHLRRKATP
jgi:hypothetical protein